ncbi:Ldh family oxidoreductase [Arthrobacter sp. CG_A4]|uniref:Ldh family oxidoreductase n=1 Tax=Arthrobacter sp. CG_A4 TaxID=3071706 RepID=UPI002DFD68D3|nr:(2R)-3-sulfolactate dehydrogenase (NADP+) [Arthrobacter sp. CG_A4]
MNITFEDAVNLATDLLVDVGHPRHRAAAVARALALADAWGLASHGLLRLPIYLDRSEAGGYATNAELQAVMDLGALTVLDGGGGLGHWQLSEAVGLAVPKAKQYGLAAVAIGNSGHCGALGVYAADAAEAGMASLIVSCGPAVLPGWGGTKRLLSTSPIAAGFPLDGAPAIVDLALSTVARGKIAAYANRGEELPEGWALDADGQPTTNPHEALSGMLSPLGGAKGFALAFMVEALTAGLVGPTLSKDMPDFFDRKSYAQPQGIAHLLIVIDPSRTDVNGDPEAAARRFADLAAATVGAGGRVPGSRRLAPSQVASDQLLDVEDGLLAGLEGRRSSAASLPR